MSPNIKLAVILRSIPEALSFPSNRIKSQKTGLNSV